MKHILILKFLTYFFSVLIVSANVIDFIYAYIFSKPIFVHFYPIKKKLSKQQKHFLERHVSFYINLSNRHKIYFEHRLVMFFRAYDFVSREGFEITPEVKVLIASSYIKLTFGMRRYLTKIFEKIIVYPNTFYSVITKKWHKGEYNPALKIIVFSWEDFLIGDLITNDNLNLGIHEFVHALTFHGKKSNDISASIFSRIYQDLNIYLTQNNNLIRIKESNYFRPYAFTNKIEFMAVISEHFFESPKVLELQFPELFSRLEKMFNYKSILDQQLSR